MSQPRPEAPGLTRRELRFVTLTAVCLGGDPDRMAEQIHEALATGDLTATEIREFVLHFAIYAGLPSGAQADGLVRAQLQKLGIAAQSPQPAPDPLVPTDPDRLAAAERCFTEINLLPAPARDTPYLEVGVMALAFGHLWLRPGLGRRERRLISITCAGASGAIGPIYAHVGAALRTGDLSAAEIDDVITEFAARHSAEGAAALRRAAGDTVRQITDTATE